MRMGERLYVHKGDIVEEGQLPEGNGREEYVEVIVRGAGRCRRRRLEEVVPEIAEALSRMNASLIAVCEQMEIRE